jgi:hypothetical protein
MNSVMLVGAAKTASLTRKPVITPRRRMQALRRGANEARWRRIKWIRGEIAQGTYETDQKLKLAIDRLLACFKATQRVRGG